MSSSGIVTEKQVEPAAYPRNMLTDGKLPFRQNVTLTGSSEYATTGLLCPYSFTEFAIPINGPARSSCALVNVKAWAQMKIDVMQVHNAVNTATPSILAICLFTYDKISNADQVKKIPFKNTLCESSIAI